MIRAGGTAPQRPPSSSSPSPSSSPSSSPSAPAASPRSQGDFIIDSPRSQTDFVFAGSAASSPYSGSNNSFSGGNVSLSPQGSAASDASAADTDSTAPLDIVSDDDTGFVDLADFASSGRSAEELATRFTQDPRYNKPPPSSYPDSDASSFQSESTTESGTVTVFHGTTKDAAYNIRDNGFLMSEKNEGATRGAALADTNLDYASRHHYFTKAPKEAKEMGELTSELLGQAAAVLKARLPKEYASTLKPDFAMRNGDRETAFVSEYDTPASFITETRNVRR